MQPNLISLFIFLKSYTALSVNSNKLIIIFFFADRKDFVKYCIATVLNQKYEVGNTKSVPSSDYMRKFQVYHLFCLTWPLKFLQSFLRKSKYLWKRGLKCMIWYKQIINFLMMNYFNMWLMGQFASQVAVWIQEILEVFVALSWFKICPWNINNTYNMDNIHRYTDEKTLRNLLAILWWYLIFFTQFFY